ncbi:MAG: GntR family transcriptional regulator [Pseudonocardiaceae bacterium]
MPTTPLYQKIADELRGAILTGELPAGSQLKTEPELQEQYGTSRNTVRGALRQLISDGLVETRGRLGTYVREYKPLYWNLHTFERGDRRDDPTTGIDEWQADMLDQGVKPHTAVSVRILPAPADIACYLTIEPGAMVLRRRRVRYADDVPVAIADSWFPEETGRRTVDGFTPLLAERPVVMKGGIVHTLGITQRWLDDEITVRMPTAEEASLLELSEGSPVGQVARVGLDDNEQPVRVMITVFPGHRLKLRYRLGM